MTEDICEKIEAIIAPVAQSNLASFAFYAHSLIALACKENAKDDELLTYYYAWGSFSAIPMRNYLKGIPDVALILNPEQINEMAELIQINSITPAEYVKSICPMLMLSSPDDVFSYLRSLNDKEALHRVLFYDCVKVIAVVSIGEKLNRKPYPSMSEMPKTDGASISEVIISEYSQLKNTNEPYQKLYFSDGELLKLWKLIYGFTFEPTPVKRAVKAKKFFNRLEEANFTDEEKYDLFHCSKQFDKLKNKDDINSPSRYLHRVFSYDDIDISNQNGEVSPGNPFFANQKLIDETITMLHNMDSVDYIRAALFMLSKNDIALENGFVYRQLIRELTVSTRTLIFQPNPDFVSMCMTDKSVNQERLVFVFTSSTLALIYLNRFPKGNFAVYENVNGSIKIFEKSEDDRFQHINVSVPSDFRLAFIFVRNLQKDEILTLLRVLKKEPLQSFASVYLHIPNAYLDSKESNFREELFTDFQCKSIYSFDSSVSSGELKKKCLLKLTTDDIQKKTVPIYKFSQADKDDKKTIMLLQPWPVNIPADKLFDNAKTIPARTPPTSLFITSRALRTRQASGLRTLSMKWRRAASFSGGRPENLRAKPT